MISHSCILSDARLCNVFLHPSISQIDTLSCGHFTAISTKALSLAIVERIVIAFEDRVHENISPRKTAVRARFDLTVRYLRRYQLLGLQ